MVKLTNAQVDDYIHIIYACSDAINTAGMILKSRSTEVGIADEQQELIDDVVESSKKLIANADSMVSLPYAAAFGDRNDRFFKESERFIKKNPVVIKDEHKSIRK